MVGALTPRALTTMTANSTSSKRHFTSPNPQLNFRFRAANFNLLRRRKHRNGRSLFTQQLATFGTNNGMINNRANRSSSRRARSTNRQPFPSKLGTSRAASNVTQNTLPHRNRPNFAHATSHARCTRRQPLNRPITTAGRRRGLSKCNRRQPSSTNLRCKRLIRTGPSQILTGRDNIDGRPLHPLNRYGS